MAVTCLTASLMDNLPLVALSVTLFILNLSSATQVSNKQGSNYYVRMESKEKNEKNTHLLNRNLKYHIVEN